MSRSRGRVARPPASVGLDGDGSRPLLRVGLTPHRSSFFRRRPWVLALVQVAVLYAPLLFSCAALPASLASLGVDPLALLHGPLLAGEEPVSPRRGLNVLAALLATATAVCAVSAAVASVHRRPPGFMQLAVTYMLPLPLLASPVCTMAVWILVVEKLLMFLVSGGRRKLLSEYASGPDEVVPPPLRAKEVRGSFYAVKPYGRSVGACAAMLFVGAVASRTLPAAFALALGLFFAYVVSEREFVAFQQCVRFEQYMADRSDRRAGAVRSPDSLPRASSGGGDSGSGSGSGGQPARRRKKRQIVSFSGKAGDALISLSLPPGAHLLTVDGLLLLRGIVVVVLLGNLSAIASAVALHIVGSHTVPALSTVLVAARSRLVEGSLVAFLVLAARNGYTVKYELVAAALLLTVSTYGMSPYGIAS